MTNREYIVSKTSKFNLAKADIELILIENDLNPNEEVDVNSCKLALYSSFYSMIPLADITEGDMSVKWNMEAIKLFFAGLAKELKLENPFEGKKPTIKSIRIW